MSVKARVVVSRRFDWTNAAVDFYAGQALPSDLNH